MSVISAYAQVERTTPEFTVERTHGIKLGQTKPIREYLDARATSNDKLQQLKANRPSYVRNFVGREVPLKMYDGALPKGGDPLVQMPVTRDGGLAVTPEINVAGISSAVAGAGVPDPNGDVSDQYYVQTVNATWIQVFDKLGNKIGSPWRANAIWSQVGRTSRGDPIIIYDHDAGRWFITEFPPSNHVLLAISDTEDPLGSWTAWDLPTPAFPDYPKYGIWEDMYVLTTNEGAGPGMKYYAIDREDILAGKDTIDMQRFSTTRPGVGGFIVATPVNWVGDSLPAAGTKPMIMHLEDDAWGNDVDAIRVVELSVDFENEDNTTMETFTLETAPYDSDICSVSGPGFTCIPQPNGTGIDGIPFVIMNRIDYRNFGTHSSVVLNFAVDVTGDDDAGVRWMELRKPSDGEWTVHQEGTVGSQDGENRFMGGISIDSRGNIGLAYNVSSENTFPSLRFTGRLESDPLGQMTVEEYEFGTGGGSVNTDRFGDYASMSVDEQDMFWYTGEFVPENGAWGTRVVGFKLERKSDDLGPFALIGPQDDAGLESEELTVAFKNFGIESQSDFSVGYIFNNGTAVVEDVSIDPLLTDSIYEHTFEDEIKFDPFGMYPVKVFTVLESDSNALNDTCVFVINKLARNDAQIFAVDGIQAAICDTFLDVLVYLRNNGVDTLTSATVTIEVGAADPIVIPWEGSLATGEMEGLPTRLAEMSIGINDVSVFSSMPNGVQDDEPTNDQIDLELEVSPGDSRVILTLLTDLFPEETSWRLEDDKGNLLYEAGPFMNTETEHIFEWCLEEDSCYVFYLEDSFGDGITGYGVSGDFEIRHEEGQILASLGNADFGSEYEAPFCVDVTGCSMTALPTVAHETTPGASNGFVSLFANGGLPPYQYSSNGGFTFQSSPVFTNLSPASYVFVVEDADGCRVSIPVQILACDIQIMYDVMNATGMDQPDGQVTINTEGGSGAVQYSIDGGDTYQTSPVFAGLIPGIYQVSVIDSVNCTVTDSVEVKFSSSVEFTTQGHLIKVYPNPSAGDFYFAVEGLADVHRLTFQVFDETGRVLLTREAANYSGTIKGYFTLNTVPSGMYFLRLDHPGIDRLVRVVKQ